MKILFAASEAVPYCKTGGLADVVGTLAQRLGALGHDVCLFLPKYRDVRAEPLAGGPARVVRVRFDGADVDVGLRFLHRRAVTTYFIDYPRFFDREGLYGASGRDHEDNDRRFALYALAALKARSPSASSPTSCTRTTGRPAPSART